MKILSFYIRLGHDVSYDLLESNIFQVLDSFQINYADKNILCVGDNRKKQKESLFLASEYKRHN